MEQALAEIGAAGFAVVPGALSPSEVSEVVASLGEINSIDGGGERGGQRNLFATLPLTRLLAIHSSIHRWPAALLGPRAFAMQALLFDKTVAANWKVAWHQDLTIPVATRVDLPGFGPWSDKAGIPHVQPPADLLSRLLIVRIHLDACDTDNGPVRLLPGSHAGGKLTPGEIDRWKATSESVEALCPAGGLLIMRPLLLHASSRANTPAHRRVIHLVYAADELPGALDWHEREGA